MRSLFVLLLLVLLAPLVAAQIAVTNLARTDDLFAPGSIGMVTGVVLAIEHHSPHPTEIAYAISGVTVEVDGVPARMLYVGPLGAQFLVPAGTIRSAGTLRFTRSQASDVLIRSPVGDWTVPITLAPGAPGVFLQDDRPVGMMIVNHFQEFHHFNGQPIPLWKGTVAVQISVSGMAAGGQRGEIAIGDLRFPLEIRNDPILAGRELATFYLDRTMPIESGEYECRLVIARYATTSFNLTIIN
jgi:uncharacterized protein (TIGR03437 family)